MAPLALGNLFGMATTTTEAVGHGLRQAREGVGLSRAQLAGLTGCSLAALANIEQGAVPKRSKVLAAALAVIAAHAPTKSSEAAGGNRGSAKSADAGDGHGEAYS